MSSVLMLLALAFVEDAEVVQERPLPVFRTGRAFAEELNRPLDASWKDIPRRKILRSLVETQRIALLLDRRIDPSRAVALDISRQPLSAALNGLAREADASTTTIGNTVYIGPPAQAAALGPLARKRAEELPRIAKSVSPARRIELRRRHTVSWNDLDSPAEIVAGIAEHHGLTIERLELVPHDLWAGWALPDATATQAFSLVLIQFDLTFEWTADGSGIRIVPIPDDLPIEANYMVADAAQLAERWGKRFPEASFVVRGNEVRVRGTFESLAEVLPIVAASRIADEPERTTADVLPLARREFTLHIENTPAQALMKELEKSGIRFEYDPRRLAAAGIDLDTPIAMDVKQVGPDEFFHAMLDPLKIAFTLDGITVRLKAK